MQADDRIRQGTARPHRDVDDLIYGEQTGPVVSDR